MLLQMSTNILDHIHADNGVLLTPGMYEIIRGECLALRAFLHFDLMRLFGPVPGRLRSRGGEVALCQSGIEGDQTSGFL